MALPPVATMAGLILASIYERGMTKRTGTTTAWPDFSETRLNLLRKRLTAFFRRSGHSMCDAEDLAQDVFARLASSAQSPTRKLDGYVFTIARNLQRDNVRRLQVRTKNGRSVDQDVYPLVHEGSDALDAERVLINREEADRLFEGLAELPERTREIFLLYRLDGVSQREIAAHLGVSISTVEKNVAKAMLHLLQKLGRDK